jgi:hypothetical protein
MQDYGVIRMMMQVPALELLQCVAKVNIVGILEPAAQEGEITVGSLLGCPTDVVARLVQIESVPLLKNRWTCCVRHVIL